MERKTLIILAAAVALLMGVVGFAGTGGLPSGTKVRAAAELDNNQKADESFARYRRVVEGALENEPALFRARGFDETWPARLRAAQQRLDEIEAQGKELSQLLDENDKDSEGKINDLLARMSTSRAFLLGEAAEMAGVAQRRLDFKKRRPDMVAAIKKDLEAIEATGIEPLEAQVARAVTDWPGKKQDLERRLQLVRNAKATAGEDWKKVEAENAKDEADIDYDLLIDAANTIGELRQNSAGVAANLPKLIDQLYWSWEKILADIEIREGQDVTFHIKIKTVRSRFSDSEDKASETKAEEIWVKVPENRYKQMKGNLGMSLERKPFGKYDVEVDRLTQPPGYGFMASPEQKRNRYGYWDRRGGGSFWVWYGQYSLMRDLIYGGRGYYRPIGADDWGRYDSTRRRGSTYYGRDSTGKRAYGSDGSRTRTSYSNSKYVRSNGYKSSRYVKSGGKYRGSRYASRSSSGRGGWGGRSRFGGGK